MLTAVCYLSPVSIQNLMPIFFKLEIVNPTYNNLFYVQNLKKYLITSS